VGGCCSQDNARLPCRDDDVFRFNSQTAKAPPSLLFERRGVAFILFPPPRIIEGSGAPKDAPYRSAFRTSARRTRTPKTHDAAFATPRLPAPRTRGYFAVRTARPGVSPGRSPEPPAIELARPFRRTAPARGFLLPPPELIGRISTRPLRSAPPNQTPPEQRPLASRAYVYSYIWDKSQ
jgi:hypothetical protein